MNVYFNNKFNPDHFNFIIGSTLPGFTPDRLLSPYLHYGIPIMPEGPGFIGEAVIQLVVGELKADTIVVSGENIDKVVFQWGGTLENTYESEVYFETASHIIKKANTIYNVRVRLFPIDIEQPMVLNAVYVGDHLTIPNMKSAPEVSDDLFSNIERSYEGFALGYGRAILEVINADFVRIENDILREIRNKYILKVGNTIPHWIDLYPEADDKFSAIWGTLNTGSIKYSKRIEYPFFWDFKLSWTEAK